MAEWLLVLLGGAVGASARYGFATLAQRRTSSWPQVGTFVANMTACLLLGFFVGLGTPGVLGPSGQALLSTGFCGALSTWSTFSNELLALESARRLVEAGLYLLVSIALGLGLSFAGAGLAGLVG